MIESKFNFIPASSLNRELGSRYTLTFDGKRSLISFSADYVRDKCLLENFLLFYIDVEKNAVAWKIIQKDKLGNLVGAKILKPAKRPNGQVYLMSVGKIVKPLRIDRSRSYKKLPIKTYKTSLIEGNLDYVVITHEKDE